MTPGILNVPIFKGAKYEHLLTFKVAGTETLVDLTGLSPFVFTISHPTKDLVLVTGTVTDTDLENGEITILATPTQTETLNLGYVRIGLRDVVGNPYLAETVPVLFFSPPPP